MVHQKELLFGFMTPREHLIFHAIARMAKKYKLRDIEERVDEVGTQGLGQVNIINLSHSISVLHSLRLRALSA